MPPEAMTEDHANAVELRDALERQADHYELAIRRAIEKLRVPGNSWSARPDVAADLKRALEQGERL